MAKQLTLDLPKATITKGDRMYHILFGWCCIEELTLTHAKVKMECKKITYMNSKVGLVIKEPNKEGTLYITTPISELKHKEKKSRFISFLKELMQIKIEY